MIGRVRRTYHAFPQRPVMVLFSLFDRTMKFQLPTISDKPTLRNYQYIIFLFVGYWVSPQLNTNFSG